MTPSSLCMYPKTFEPFSWLKIQSRDVEEMLDEHQILRDCIHAIADKVTDIVVPLAEKKKILPVQLVKRVYSDTIYFRIQQRGLDNEVSQQIEEVQAEFLNYVLKVSVCEDQMYLMDNLCIDKEYIPEDGNGEEGV